MTAASDAFKEIVPPLLHLTLSGRETIKGSNHAPGEKSDGTDHPGIVGCAMRLKAARARGRKTGRQKKLQTKDLIS